MSPARRVFVTGASGLLGGRLIDALVERGDQVVALSRSERRSPDSRSGVHWVRGDLNGEADAALGELLRCDAIVHLAGEPIAAGRWTRRRKERLIDSRVAATQRIVAALEKSAERPGVLLCASASGFYGPRGEELLDEGSPPGGDFLSRLCADWEEAARRASALGIRVVSLRFGVVLSPDGGALTPMVRAFRMFAGGPLGPPDRWFPWIHWADAVGAMQFALDRDDVAGPLNLVSPEPARMGEFAKAVGRTLGRPSWLPVPGPLLGIALGEMGEALIPGQHIRPRAIQDAGFEFQHANLSEALRSCLG